MPAARISPDGRAIRPGHSVKSMLNDTKTAPLGRAGRSTRATMPELVIPPRYRGPAGSGNGGYVCGRIAAYADGPVAVTLRRPPPLATPMTVEQAGDDGALRVRHGGTLIAEATTSTSPTTGECIGVAIFKCCT